MWCNAVITNESLEAKPWPYNDTFCGRTATEIRLRITLGFKLRPELFNILTTA